ncbi:MAG: hypothetical protein ACRD3C_26330 [Vicinamibacterales bacterium]
MVCVTVAVVVALVAAAAPSYAQAAASQPVRRIAVDVGVGLLGGAPLGSADANLRANEQSRQAYRLFTTSSDIARAPLWHVRTALALTRRLALEGALTKGSPDIRTLATSDAEAAPPVTVTERVDQYFIDGSLLFMLEELRIGARLVPFVAAGAGYLRQLHEGRTVIEQGQVYHTGGGIKYWLLTRNAGMVRATGVRGDARVYLTRGGISLEEGLRSHLAISGSVFVGF